MLGLGGKDSGGTGSSKPLPLVGIGVGIDVGSVAIGADVPLTGRVSGDGGRGGNFLVVLLGQSVVCGGYDVGLSVVDTVEDTMLGGGKDSVVSGSNISHALSVEQEFDVEGSGVVESVVDTLVGGIASKGCVNNSNSAVMVSRSVSCVATVGSSDSVTTIVE